MPRNDTASEAEAWSVASSTIIDTYSEPPRCSGKFAEKILKRAYGGMDPEESVSPSTANGSDIRKSRSSASSCKASVSSKSSSRLPGGSCRKATMSNSTSKPSATSSSRSRPSGSYFTRSDGNDSISGRSSMSALERRLQSSKCGAARSTVVTQKSASTKKSSRPDPNERMNPLAIVPRKQSVDPPSAAGSACSSEEPGALVAYVYNDPPSTSLERKNPLSTCEESDEEEQDDDAISYRGDTRGSGSLSESHYSSEYSRRPSNESYSRSESRSSYADDASGTLEDASDSLIDIAENALAIRDDGDITVPSVGSQAIVARANTNEGAIVPSSGRYLANAVDNNAAIVPFDSTLFESYDHTFVKCPEHLRFLFLYTFLKKNTDKKVMIFFSTTNSAKFHARLLDHFHIPCLTMHSRQKREHFINTFFKFSDMDEGILCATDAAGRDLDIPPSVDWVVQFEPPDDPTEYILRVARISCDSDRVGRSLLFLNPGESGFLKYYHSASIPVSEFEIPKLAEIQNQIEYHVNESDRFLKYAKDAYGSYLIAYASHSFRDVYNVHDLNKNDVAAAFGLISLPSICDGSEDEVSVGSSEARDQQAAGQAPKEGARRTWSSSKKKKEKTWMKGEKTWPHCQIKVHPKFRENYIPRDEEES